MKGFSLPEEMGWTLILLILFVIVAFLLVSLILLFRFVGKSPATYSVEFVKKTNDPFIVGDVISRLEIGDKQFLEHAIELVTTSRGSPEEVSRALGKFMDTYDYDYSNIIIVKDAASPEARVNVMDMNVHLRGMGMCEDTTYAAKSGICYHYRDTPTWKSCGIGRAFIENPSTKACPEDSICCMDLTDDEYAVYSARNNEMINVVRCGGDFNDDNIDDGICEAGCSVGRIQMYRDVAKTCDSVNEGKTPFCCAPKYDELLLPAGAYIADIPVLYKDTLGFVEVAVE